MAALTSIQAQWRRVGPTAERSPGAAVVPSMTKEYEVEAGGVAGNSVTRKPEARKAE